MMSFLLFSTICKHTEKRKKPVLLQFFTFFYLQQEKNDYLCIRVSHTRPAPSEFPQGLTAARVGGRSGAMY